MKLKKDKVFLRDMITYAAVIAAYIVLSILSDNKILNKSMRGQLVPICVYVVMAISLNLVVGISGELSLGHAGFMSVGAFTGAVVSACFANSIVSEPLRLIVAMAFGGVIAAIAGVIIGVPVLRLSGDYLAIVTLAFGEIIRSLMNVLYIALDNGKLQFSFNDPAAVTGTLLVNGPQGAQGIDKISTFTMGFALVMFALIVVLNLIRSRAGRAIMACRDNRIAAESVGISVMKYKMMAFVTSALLAGMAGALYALNFSTVTASKFKFDLSISVLVFVVLGGIGNIWGSIISASVLTVLPELLREVGDYRMLVYAIVLVAVMLGTNRQWRALLNAVLVLTLVPVLLTGRLSIALTLVIYAVLFCAINYSIIVNAIKDHMAVKAEERAEKQQ